MATTLETFVPDVKVHVGACPEATIINALRNSCIRFCTDTWIIRENLTGDIAISTDDYTIIASVDNECLGVIDFLYNKKKLPHTTEEELDLLDAGWRTADPGTPTSVTAPEPDRVKLNRIPEATVIDGLKVTFAVRPTDAALSVNDKLFNDWRDTIKYGALQELMEIPGKSWSDMKQSVWYGTRFNFGIQKGKARATMGNMKKSTSAVMRSWI